MKNTEYKFPLIARGQDSDLEVKFTSEKEGCVIRTHDKNTYPLGENVTSWISCFNTDHWTILSHDLNKPTLEELRRQEKEIQDKIKEVEAESDDWPKEGDQCFSFVFIDWSVIDFKWKGRSEAILLKSYGNIHPTKQSAKEWGEKWINRMKEEIKNK